MLSMLNDLILLLVLFRLLPSRPCEFSIEFAQKPQHIRSMCKGHVLVHILPTVLVTASPYMSLGDKSPED